MYVQIFLENFLFSEQINPVSKYFGSSTAAPVCCCLWKWNYELHLNSSGELPE